MLESVPRAVKIVVLVAAIVGIGSLIYYEAWYFTYGRPMRREQIRRDAELARSRRALSDLIEKGEQEIGRWSVRATHVKELEFRDATLTRTEDSRVVEEIKAPSISFPIASASDPEARILADVMGRLAKATVTTYDDEGKATTEQKDEMEFWLKKTGPPAGASSEPPAQE